MLEKVDSIYYNLVFILCQILYPSCVFNDTSRDNFIFRFRPQSVEGHKKVP